jgi:HK97 family phage portal protein
VPATFIDPQGAPVEIAPGRGDLRRFSAPFGAYDRGLATLVGGRTVSYADLFATQPLVATTVMRIMTWAMRCPLKAYVRTGSDSRERLRPGDHALADALASPWERGATAQLVQALLGPLLVHGNAVVRVDDGARGAFRFSPADYRFARPIMPWRDVIAGWDFDVDDPLVVEEGRPADTVLHVAWWSPFGPLGISPLRQLGTTIATDEAAVRHQAAMWRNGVRSPTVITTGPDYVGQSEEFQSAMMENLREDIDVLGAGPDNSGRPLLLPPGLDAKPMGYTAVEAELISQRSVAREEAHDVYQLPTPQEKLQGQAVAELRQNGYLDGLAPPLLLIEALANAQVVAGLLREPDLYVEFDLSGLLRGDRLKEVQAMREAIASAMMTPNEARARDNMPRSDIPAMDKFYLPFNNLWPVDQDPPKSGARGLQPPDTTPPK